MRDETGMRDRVKAQTRSGSGVLGSTRGRIRTYPANEHLRSLRGSTGARTRVAGASRSSFGSGSPPRSSALRAHTDRSDAGGPGVLRPPPRERLRSPLCEGRTPPRANTPTRNTTVRTMATTLIVRLCSSWSKASRRDPTPTTWFSRRNRSPAGGAGRAPIGSPPWRRGRPRSRSERRASSPGPLAERSGRPSGGGRSRRSASYQAGPTRGRDGCSPTRASSRGIEAPGSRPRSRPTRSGSRSRAISASPSTGPSRSRPFNASKPSGRV